MGTLVLKMFHAARPALKQTSGAREATARAVRLLDSSRPYVWLGENEWGWWNVTFPKNRSRLLGGNSAKQLLQHRKGASSFLLLRDLGHGTDGRVWHACGMRGEGSCAIKFLHQPDNKVALERECGHWTQLEPGKARVVRLGGKEALLMPLVHFVPYADWTQEHHSAAKKAVANCVSKGLEHTDFKPRHVGFTSLSRANGKTLRAMLIDLTRMAAVPHNDPAAILRMEQALLQKEAEQ